jgi:L-amino acid N-acyltransferase YncA
MEERSASAVIIVRDCLPEDVVHITSIYNYFIELPGDVTTFEEVKVSVEQMMERFENIKAINFPFLVAIDQTSNTVLGYAYGTKHKPNESCYKYSGENSIYLHPDYTGQGIGTMLLKELLVCMYKMGIKQVIARIALQNKPGSPALHKKFGFNEVAVFKKIGYKYAKWVDVLQMQCDLDQLFATNTAVKR